MNTITLLLDQQTLDKLVFFYAQNAITNPNPYVDYFFKVDGCSISVYKFKVVFQGAKSAENASIWQAFAKSSSQNQQYLGGSDEVGTGSYLGPIVVCACLIKESDIDYLKSIGVGDSKKIDDQKILEIAPLIAKRVTYSNLTLPNKKYNQIHQKMNINAIKAYLHNSALLQLRAKSNNTSTFVIDQFCLPSTYYSYLVLEEQVEQNLHFETKSEDKYLCVACASIIARYVFLKQLEKDSKKYGITLPTGAGADVDAVARRLVASHGKSILEEQAKLDFANTKRVIN